MPEEAAAICFQIAESNSLAQKGKKARLIRAGNHLLRRVVATHSFANFQKSDLFWCGWRAMSLMIAHLKPERSGETFLDTHAIARACSTASEIEGLGKGRSFSHIGKGFIAPDMLVFTASGAMFIEAKHKSVFTGTAPAARGLPASICATTEIISGWRRNQTAGLACFYHQSPSGESDRAYGCPSECPTGLYAGELFDLLISENHRSKKF